MINTLTHDDCCSPKLSCALLADLETLMSLRTWTCPECGTEWRAELHKLDHGTGSVHWAPHEHAELFKQRSAGC